MIEIDRDYTFCKFLTALPEAELKLLRERLKYRDNSIVFSPYYRFKRRAHDFNDGWKYLYDLRTHKFPSGVLFLVEEFLKEKQIPYRINELRDFSPLKDLTPLELKEDIKLRDYQENILFTLLDKKEGIIRAATGAGKTLIFIALAGKLFPLQQVIYVRRTALFNQTVKALEKALNIKIGRIKGKIFEPEPITVAMVPTVSNALDKAYKKNINKYKIEDDDEVDQTTFSDAERQRIVKFIEGAEVIIYDECHGIAAASAQLISKASTKALYRVGFSATPWRDDGLDILITAATGPKLVDIPASILIKKGYLVAPHIHFYQSPELPIGKDSPGDDAEFQEVYKYYVAENDVRNKKIAALAKHLVDLGHKPLILVQRRNHGELLKKAIYSQGLNVDYIDGRSSDDTRDKAISDLIEGKLDILIGSSILDEGIDIPQIDALINAGGGKSSAKYYQKIGRVIRPYPNKDKAIVIDFLDQNIKFLKKHAKERIKIINTEDEYKLKIQQKNKT